MSLNQITTNHCSLIEMVETCVEEGISWIGPWRHKLDSIGIKESARVIKNANLKVSSLCRGGMFPAINKEKRNEILNQNLRAIDEAVEIGADTLVLVCGSDPSISLEESYKMIVEGIEFLIPYAEQANVKLGIEPLHPMFAAERSAIVNLKQTNDIVEYFDHSILGVIIDVYHVWWDPSLYQEIERATEKIFGFHVNDWIPISGKPLTSRGVMGDGTIQIPRIRKAVEDAGYKGPIEVEILSDELWKLPCRKIVQLTKDRFEKFV